MGEICDRSNATTTAERVEEPTMSMVMTYVNNHSQEEI